MRIAVDAMGGDNAPNVVIEGALLACKEFGYDIVLVGDNEKIQHELFKRGVHATHAISVCHASEVIGMDEPAALSVRKKRDSSINVSARLLRDGKVEAFVSAGNTGAVVCAVALRMGLLNGVQRPGIGLIYPTLKDLCVLIDVGANIHPKPEHLLQYAIMGDVLQKYLFGKKTARIGLLNVGEEEAKGTDFIKETHRLLNASGIKFTGNVEGGDIYTGEYDVIVCDGFVGNVVLKVSESLAHTLTVFLKRKLKQGFLTQIGALLSMPAFKALKKEIDYSEYGGAPLLGVNGVCIICHGGSSAKAIKNAIREAAEFVKLEVNQHIIEAIARQEGDCPK
ncbi:MAG: phosphate acyltransferase PlsX [Candidatus Omnitrophica bacterium]|nr:phosphate acyltransferase PlsX [Candidatus Omnitrophota bacterium]